MDIGAKGERSALRMRPEEFVQRICKYFIKTHKNVINAIALYVKNISETHLEVLYNELVESVSPKTPIGTSDIKLICHQKGIPM